MPTAAVFVAGPISSPTDVGSLSISGPYTSVVTITPESGHGSTYRGIWSNVGEGAPETEPSFSLYVADTNTLMATGGGGVRFASTDMTPSEDVANVVGVRFDGTGWEFWLNGVHDNGASIYSSPASGSYSGQLTVGAITLDPVNPFFGSIENLSIWLEELNLSQLAYAMGTSQASIQTISGLTGDWTVKNGWKYSGIQRRCR